MVAPPAVALVRSEPVGPSADWISWEAENAADAARYKRLTAAEAEALQRKAPSISPWRVIVWQLVAGCLIGMGAWALSGQVVVAASAAYGALVVVVPAAVLARGIMSPIAGLNALSAAAAFMVWEMVKIGLSVAMFIAAPQLIEDVSWPALLAGLILTMKVYWLAAVYKPRPLD